MYHRPVTIFHVTPQTMSWALRSRVYKRCQEQTSVLHSARYSCWTTSRTSARVSSYPHESPRSAVSSPNQPRRSSTPISAQPKPATLIPTLRRWCKLWQTTGRRAMQRSRRNSRGSMICLKRMQNGTSWREFCRMIRGVGRQYVRRRWRWSYPPYSGLPRRVPGRVSVRVSILISVVIERTNFSLTWNRRNLFC